MREPTADNLTLSAQNVREEAAACLRAHLPLAADGYMVTTDLLIDVLLHAAASGSSIEAACDNLLAAADANTVRGYLNDQLSAEDLVMLEQRMNDALGSDLPRKIRRAKLEIAIDTHDQPFYGKSPALRAMARRGAARSGTTYFMRIASVNIMLHGLRITLGVVFVRPDDSMAEIVDLLCDKVRRLGLRISHVWLDRGFASVDVLDTLRLGQVPAIVACPVRGKRGGTRALCRGRGSHMTTHAFRRTSGGHCNVPVAVVRLAAEGPTPVRWMLFVRIRSKLSPHQIRDRYRKRFGIESSYRQMRQVRIRTNTRNPALRFVYLAIALILVNIWSLLRFRYCQIPRRGSTGRPIDTRLFKLRHLANFLRLAIEQQRGVSDHLHAQAVPRLSETVVH